MPLYLPNEGILVRFRVDEEDEDAILDLNEELEQWNYNLFDEGPEIALDPEAPIGDLRKRPDYVSDKKIWVFTNVDMSSVGGWFFREFDHPAIQIASCCMGTSVIASERDAGLEALAACYLPVHLLWHVWKHEQGDLKRLARAALDGDEKSLPVLADALTDANHPLALAARFVCADVLGVGKVEGMASVPLKEYPRTLGLLPDGSAAFVQNDKGEVRLLSFKDGKALRGSRREVPELTGEGGGGLAFSPCGRFVAAVSKRVLACYRVQPWGLLWRMERGEGEEALGAQFSPGGTQVGSQCKDGRLRVWDTETGDELGELPVPRKSSPLNLTDAGWAILSEDGKLGLWSPGGAARVKRAPLPEGHGPRTLSRPWASPDGTRLAGRSMAGGSSGHIILIDVPGKKVLTQPVDGYHDPVGFTPDGSRLFTKYGNAMRAWDGRTGAPAGTAELKKGFDCHAFSADGGTVVGWSHGDPVLRALTIGRSDGPEPAALDMESNILCVAISADGERVAAANPRSCGPCEVSPSGENLASGTADGCIAVAYAPDGLLFEGRQNGSVALVKGSKRRWRAELGSPARCVAASPGGGLFAAGLASGAVVVFNERGRELFRTTCHTGPVAALAFDGADGLLSAGADGFVFKIDTESGEAEEALEAGLPLSSLAVSVDGGLAAAVSPGKKVVLFGPDAGGTQEINSLCAFSACFTPSGVLVVGCWGEVVLLRVPVKEAICRLPAGRADVSSVAWCPQNGLLAAGGWDRHLRLWKLGTVS